MQVESIAECSKESILQYSRPSLSYHLSLRSLFCRFLSGRYTQVLVYTFFDNNGDVGEDDGGGIDGDDEENDDNDIITIDDNDETAV